MPEIDTKSELYANWYYRVVVNTTWFPLAQFISFMALMVFGWTFVNVVTLKRSDPFTSGNNTYKDIKTMLTFAPIIFLLSGLIVFRQPHDLSGYCNNAADNDNHVHMLRASHGYHNRHAPAPARSENGSDLLWLHSIQ